MKIIIKSIEAKLIDVSTVESCSFKIVGWVVSYEVNFPPRRETQINGKLFVEGEDFKYIGFVQNYIEKLYQSVDEILKKEPTLL